MTLPKFESTQVASQQSLLTHFPIPPGSRRTSHRAEMKISPNWRRRIVSISSWMPRSKPAESAICFGVRSRKTMLTSFAAGIR